MEKYLVATEIIDWQHPEIVTQALKLKQSEINATAKACFEWVRDNIYHSYDYQMNPVTCKASDVLQYKTGYCFAKSHLLAALLRSLSIPTGFCYQRLSIFDDGAPYSLHGFNGIYLQDYGWYRVDGRGNKPGIDARFQPPQEQLAFQLNFPEEIDCKYIFAEPLPQVVETLQTYNSWERVLHNLPDIESEELSRFSSIVDSRPQN